MRVLLGVLLILSAVFVGAFVDVYLLIKGIIDIVNNGDLLKGLIEIFIREIVGGIVAVVLFISGIACIGSSKK
ncbi:hypothetical protein D3C75_416880 [compost metagenome]